MNRSAAAVVAGLVMLGCLTMVGDLSGLPILKAAGLASAASPAPKVFTAQDGFETYANHFHLDWVDETGAPRSLQVTPRVYAGLAGPYNRRNAWGAAFSYSPVLAHHSRTRPMLQAALRRAFCGPHPVVAELGVPAQAAQWGPLRVRLQPRGAASPAGFVLEQEIRCHD